MKGRLLPFKPASAGCGAKSLPPLQAAEAALNRDEAHRLVDELYRLFAAMSLEHRRVSRFVIFDWCDGIREAYCDFAAPACTVRLVAVADDASWSRTLYRVYTAPPDAVDRLGRYHPVDVRRGDGEPDVIVGGDTWYGAEREEFERTVTALEAESAPTRTMIEADSVLTTFQRLWRLAPEFRPGTAA